MSNSLDPDQARRFVGADLGPNYLQTCYRQTALVGEDLAKSVAGEGLHLCNKEIFDVRCQIARIRKSSRF